MSLRRPIAVVGPTASGKSALGLDLAERLGGEIINIDAMQLYRGMDIGTAKVPSTSDAASPIINLMFLTSPRRPVWPPIRARPP